MADQELNVWLERRDNARVQKFFFPVNPESMTFSHRRGTIDVPLWRVGTVIRPGPREPLEITFTSFFPDTRKLGNVAPSWLSQPLGSVRDPWTIRSMLRQWQNAENRKDGLTPLKLGIGPPADLALWVVMTSFEAETEIPTSLRFTITVREMQPLPLIRRVKRGPRGGKRPVRRVNTQARPRKVRTKQNENLTQIAKRVYGTTGRGEVRILWNANKAKVGPDPHKKLPKGLVLAVPDIVGVTEKGVF